MQRRHNNSLANTKASPLILKRAQISHQIQRQDRFKTDIDNAESRMNKNLHILAFLAISLAPFNFANASGTQRNFSFQGNLSDEVNGRGFLSLDQATKTLTACKSSSMETCQQHRIDADFIAPTNKKRQVFAQKDGELKICTIPAIPTASPIPCKGASSADLTPFATTFSNATRLVLNLPNGIQCTYRNEKGLSCSSARQFTDTKTTPYLSGNFSTSSGREIIHLDTNGKQSQACSGRKCRTVVGIDMLKTATRMQTGRFHPNSGDVILGLDDSNLFICSVYLDEPKRLAFNCKASALNSSGGRAFVVQRSNALDAVRFVPSIKEITSTEAYKATLTNLTQMGLAATKTATLAGKESALITDSSEKSEYANYNQEYIETSPDYYQSMDGGGGFSYDFWSDSNGHIYTDWSDPFWSAPRPGDCTARCDIEYNNRGDDCDIMGAGLMVASAVAATGAAVFSSWSGPGAGYAFLGTFGAGATLAGTVTQVCKGNAGRERIRCYNTCDR